MRARSTAVLAAAALTIPLAQAFATSPAVAGPPDGLGPWADAVVDSNQGLRSDGSTVPGDRSDPAAALGVAEGTDTNGTFYSLGFGGDLTVSFTNNICVGGNTRVALKVAETTRGQEDYPDETYLVSVARSSSGPWIPAAQLTTFDGDVAFDVTGIYNFVKVEDKSNPADFEGLTPPGDGPDIDGIMAVTTNCSPAPFTCRASALKAGLPIVGTIEPVIANDPNDPCTDDTPAPFVDLDADASGALGILGSFLASVNSDTLTAATDSNPGGVDGASASTAVEDADAGVLLFNRTLFGGNRLILGSNVTADVITSKATVSCVAGAPVFEADSQVVNLRVNGNLVNAGVDGDATVVLNTPAGTLYVNHTNQTATSVVQRAVWLDVSPLLSGLGIQDIVIGEAAVGVGTNDFGTSCA